MKRTSPTHLKIGSYGLLLLLATSAICHAQNAVPKIELNRYEQLQSRLVDPWYISGFQRKVRKLDKLIGQVQDELSLIRTTNAQNAARNVTHDWLERMSYFRHYEKLITFTDETEKLIFRTFTEDKLFEAIEKFKNTLNRRIKIYDDEYLRPGETIGRVDFFFFTLDNLYELDVACDDLIDAYNLAVERRAKLVGIQTPF